MQNESTYFCAVIGSMIPGNTGTGLKGNPVQFRSYPRSCNAAPLLGDILILSPLFLKREGF